MVAGAQSGGGMARAAETGRGGRDIGLDGKSLFACGNTLFLAKALNSGV